MSSGNREDKRFGRNGVLEKEPRRKVGKSGNSRDPAGGSQPAVKVT